MTMREEELGVSSRCFIKRVVHRRVLTAGLPLGQDVRDLAHSRYTGVKLPVIINITEILLVPWRG